MLDLSLKAIANNLKDVRQQVSEHQEFKNALESLDELILNVNAPLNIMVMGEFSTGKSTFINAILKKEVVKMNSLPTTAVITKLCYGAKDKLIVHFKNGTNKEYNSLEFERLTATEEGETNEFHKTIDYVERLLPIDALKFMTIIDSPGTNAIRKEDEATTYRFINNADTIFSLYAADQLDKQSENILLSSLNDRLKPIAIINKIDDLNEEEDDDIDVIIAEQKEKWKDKVQEIIGVSAKMALEGYLNNNRTFVQESRIEDFYKVLNDIVIPNRNKYKTNTLMDKLGEVFFLMGKAIHDIEKNNKESSKDNYEIYINKQMTLYPILDKIAQAAKPVYEYSRENQDMATSKMFLGVLYNQGILVEKDSEKAVRYLEEASIKNVDIAQWVLAIYYIEGKEEDKGYYWIKELAKKNNADAQCYLGIFYVAKEDEKLEKEGVEWLIKSAEQNCKEAQLYLGKCYEDGIGVIENIYKALEWYKKAAEQGLAKAQWKLGDYYQSQNNIDGAVEWYKKAANQGLAEAQNVLGAYYESRGYNEKAVELYKKAAEQGLAEAQNHLGLCYENGRGIEENKELAVKWFKRAAEQEYDWAQYNLGCCYDSGDGIQQDKNEAFKWFEKAAEQGLAAAQNSLGYYYENGNGIQKNKQEAFKWFKKAAEQGHSIAQYNLGRCYNSDGIHRNEQEAFKWFKKAAEQGLAAAQNDIGIYYQNGVGTEQNKQEAVKWFRKATEQGDGWAQYNLGCCYDSGNGIQQDRYEAFKWFKKAAEQGIAVAQNKMGLYYQDGIGRKKNEQEAVKWFRKTAEQGYGWAQYNLGYCYENGEDILPDKREAFKWFKKAAEQGIAVAQNKVGLYYKNGIGTEQNNEEAVRWFRKAAEQGYDYAQYNLGDCYDAGDGVQQNKQEAFKWYKKATEQGLAEAQTMIGMYYQKGEGIKQNKEEAVKWFRKATEQEFAWAQLWLGSCYEYGNGIQQDKREAFKWYKKAAEQGLEIAQVAVGDFYLDGIGTEQSEAKALEWYEKAASNGSTEAKSKIDNYKKRKKEQEEKENSNNIVPPQDNVVSNIKKEEQEKEKNHGCFYIYIILALILMIGIGWLFVSKEQQNNSLDKDKDTIRTEEQYNTPVKKELNQNVASDLSLAGISLGDDIDKMYVVLGRERQIKHQGKYTFYLYDNVQVGMENGIVKALVSNNRLAETKRGIHEGSGLEDVFHEYGNDCYETDYNDLILYEYTFPNKNGILRFAVNKSDNHVNYISVRVPDEDAGLQPANDNDVEGAKKALIMYYSCLAGDNFGEKSDAYNLLSDDMKNHMGSLDTFVASYRNTRNNDVTNIQVISSEPNRVVLGYNLKSTDSVNNNSGLKTQYFKGTMTLSKETGNWRIVDLSVQND